MQNLHSYILFLLAALILMNTKAFAQADSNSNSAGLAREITDRILANEELYSTFLGKYIETSFDTQADQEIQASPPLTATYYSDFPEDRVDIKYQDKSGSIQSLRLISDGEKKVKWDFNDRNTAGTAVIDAMENKSQYGPLSRLLRPFAFYEGYRSDVSVKPTGDGKYDIEWKSPYMGFTIKGSYIERNGLLSPAQIEVWNAVPKGLELFERITYEYIKNYKYPTSIDVFMIPHRSKTTYEIKSIEYKQDFEANTFAFKFRDGTEVIDLPSGLRYRYGTDLLMQELEDMPLSNTSSVHNDEKRIEHAEQIEKDLGAVSNALSAQSGVAVTARKEESQLGGNRLRLFIIGSALALLTIIAATLVCIKRRSRS